LDAGHQVDLIDPVPRHIDEANDALGSRTGFTATVGDGRRLDFDDGVFDVVLLFGPLYHLQDSNDRAACWLEARRVLAMGGLAFGAVISRFASLLSGLSEDVIFNPEFRDLVLQDLVDGKHMNPPGQEFFTTSYFHHPDEARSEAEEAGFEVEAVLGVEGIASWIPRLEKSWTDPERRRIIIESARAIESEPTLLGLGPHLIVVARTPAA
jgi:ubiquinone/menaquinone biosynthesis C-methylase UbiE